MLVPRSPFMPLTVTLKTVHLWLLVNKKKVGKYRFKNTCVIIIKQLVYTQNSLINISWTNIAVMGIIIIILLL